MSAKQKKKWLKRAGRVWDVKAFGGGPVTSRIAKFGEAEYKRGKKTVLHDLDGNAQAEALEKFRAMEPFDSFSPSECYYLMYVLMASMPDFDSSTIEDLARCADKELNALNDLDNILS